MGESLSGRLSRIRLIGFDVDGVFTDGRFYLSDDGVETKAFHTQDGYGVRALLREGIRVAIVSGRRSGAVEKRMAELGVEHVILGSPDKVRDFTGLADMLGIPMADTAFVGDDIPDLPLLEAVGVAIAVANAVDDIRSASDHVTRSSGGHGAVREVAELLLAARRGAAE
ncbi:MAG: HAD hydrolase family protein [Woeseiaceae bacterium]|jgi:3-deoxy-D-manno-octulosonate 8-phosphate phosphatase (KDO 8-P phosphatase)|nr:HAD hydrolase family protein [Woeseiaceae bacterium]